MVCDKRGNGMDTTDWGYVIEEMESSSHGREIWKGST